MQIRLVKLFGTDLDEALKISYVSEDEENNFVIGAKDSFQEYSANIRWIQIKEDSGDWVNCGMISYGTEEGGEVPGFWIERLMIHPNFRKKRIASNAMKIVLQENPSKNPIFTSTTKENKTALQMFKKLGFIIIDENWGDEILLKFQN